MNLKTALEWLWIGFLIVLILWWAPALMVFRYRHPWMTETELSLHLWDALMWRDGESGGGR